MGYKEKNKQINKETLMTLGMYILFFIWWYGFAYGLGNRDVEEYTYIFGLPSWFFYSCIVGYILISFLVLFIVKKFFKDVSFEEDKEREGE